MARVLAGDILQVSWVARLGSQTGMIVGHYLATAQAGQGCTDQEAADAFDTLLAAKLKGVMSSTATYSGCIVQNISPVKLGRVATVTGRGIGTVVGNAAPSQTAGVIALRTRFADRHRRGRKYIFFPSVVDILSSGLPNQSYVDRLTAIGIALMGTHLVGVQPDTTDLQFVVFSRVQKIGVAVESVQARSAFGTQRRRSSINRGDLPLP